VPLRERDEVLFKKIHLWEKTPLGKYTAREKRERVPGNAPRLEVMLDNDLIMRLRSGG
jgi:hypothetical protein